MHQIDKTPSPTIESQTDRWSAPLRHRGLELAIAIAIQAQSILDSELTKDGFETEMLPYEGGSRYQYWNDLDDQLLDDADSIYFDSSDRAKLLDTVDLHYFERNFEVRNHFSPRVKALALRTLARDLVRVSEYSDEEDLLNALSRIVLDNDGTVNVIETYKVYHPYYSLD